MLYGPVPGPSFMIDDAGNYTGGESTTFDKVEEIIPLDSDVELLVLSHSDSDHLGAVDEICDAYTVKRVIRLGYHPQQTRGEMQMIRLL